MAGMHQPSDFQVFRTLDRTSNARLLRSSTLSDGLALAHWYRDEAEILGYSDPGHHTLSLYLQGGWQTFRRDRPGLYGGPDRFCVMPAEHHSDWAVTRGLSFMHLYISPERLAGAAVRTLDCEPRSLQLEERTYIQDEPLAALCRTLERQDWNEPGERLLCTSLAHQAVDHLLLTGCGRRTDVRWQGGLAAHVRRRLADYIESHLEQPLELGSLAELAALSEYHFARMFRVSFGLPPHRYVLERRLARARDLLAYSAQSLQEVSLACGFASPSHFNRRFREAHGATPGQYRAALKAS